VLPRLVDIEVGRRRPGGGGGLGGGGVEDVPEDGPPLEEEAAGGVDGDGVGGDLALGDEGLGGGLQVALHQVVVDVDVEHLIGLPVGPRHGFDPQIAPVSSYSPLLESGEVWFAIKKNKMCQHVTSHVGTIYCSLFAPFVFH